MITKVYFGIAIRLIALFSVSMLMAVITPKLHNFFGDKPSSKIFAYINDGYDWSYLHYWFFTLCFLLFILSLINCVVSIKTLVKKHYDTSKW